MRRATRRITSSVASSAQWTSSNTTIVDPLRAQFVDERRGHGVWDRVATKERAQTVACVRGDVVERAERLRRQERVAHPPRT